MSVFYFREFAVRQSQSAMKVGTDAMVLGSLIDAGMVKKSLEIGAGTGVISLMLAQRYPELFIDAVEIEENSFEECRFNFVQSKWSERLNAVHSDIFDFEPARQYDLIFSNPPFYLNSKLNENELLSLARHNVYMPLDKLALKVEHSLSPTGKFVVIVPSENEGAWVGTLNPQLFLTSRTTVYGKEGVLKRTVLEFNRRKEALRESSLTIRRTDGSYTEAYKELTRDYHAIDL